MALADHLEPPVPDELRSLSVRGAASTVTGQTLQFAVGLATTAVLARLLTPADFGLVALVTAVGGLLTLVGDMGLSQATIQRERVTPGEVTALFWVNLAVGGTVAAALAVLAPALASVYGEPRLVGIAVVFGLAFLPVAAAVQHRALLQRRMDFRYLASADVVANAVGAGAAVAAAAAGAGYWALLVLPATVSTCQLVAAWLRVGWVPGLPRRQEDLGELLRFGGNLSGFNVVNYVARNADDALVGWRWGEAALGQYNRAYSLLLMPLRQIHGPVSAVAIPMLGRLQDDPERFRRAYVKYAALLTRLTLPAVLVMIVLARPLVLTVLGDQWVPAAELFRILGFAGIVQTVTNPMGSILLATGRTDRMFRLALVNTPLTVGAFLVGLPYGPRGVVVSYAVYNWVILIPTMWYICRGSPVGMGSILAAVGRSAVVAIATAGAAAGAVAVLPGLPTWGTLGVGLAAAGVVWLGLHRLPWLAKEDPLKLLREIRT